MKVVITAATETEWMPAYTNIHSKYKDDGHGFEVSFHKSGVGMLVSAVSLTQLVLMEKPDVIIQVGIAGTFNTNTELGLVTAISEDVLGDTGVEESCVWNDVFDLNLEKRDTQPFTNGRLPNLNFEKYNLLNLPTVTGITVNEITTKPERTALLVEKYNPFIESMEGAALHYVCGRYNMPYLQIRSISNYIGERNKANWKMKDAIVNLNNTLLEYIERLYAVRDAL